MIFFHPKPQLGTMKKFYATLIIALMFACTSVNAQSLGADIQTAQGNLSACSDVLNKLMSQIDDLKAKASAEFASKAQSIEERKAELVTRRKSIESEDHKEANMMLPLWPARIQSRESLVKEEQAVSRDAFVLALRKTDFEHRIAQVEKHIQQVFAQEVASRADFFKGVMNQYSQKLTGMTY